MARDSLPQIAQGETGVARAPAVIADFPSVDWSGTMFRVMGLADWFAERSARGMLTRAAGAWLLVGLPVIAARIWWSAAAAIAVFVVALTVYVAAARRYMHRQRQQA